MNGTDIAQFVAVVAALVLFSIAAATSSFRVFAVGVIALTVMLGLPLLELVTR